MIENGKLPIRGGQWIDTYNQLTDANCAGTIIAGVNAKNHYFVMETKIIQKGRGFNNGGEKDICPTIKRIVGNVTTI